MYLDRNRWNLMGRPKVKVLVDGMVANGCIEADEEKGYAICAVVDPETRRPVAEASGRTQFGLAKGKVFIAIEHQAGSFEELSDAERLDRYLEEFQR